MWEFFYFGFKSVPIHFKIILKYLFIVDDEDAPDIKELIKKKKRVFEASRAQNYYHLEYYLVPDSSELVKTDVVTYSMAAKIYMERHDPKVLKTWTDGEITWVAWSHRYAYI